MGLVMVAQYVDPLQAQLDKTRLESAGIYCFLSNQAVGSLQFLGINALDPMQLMVPEDDLQLAREVLGEPGVDS